MFSSNIFIKGPSSPALCRKTKANYHSVRICPKVLYMIDKPPDRLAANAASPYYDAALLERGVGIRFNGVEKNNVDEYCVSEGWVRLAVGTTMDRAGRPMTIKLKGKVEPYFRDKA